MSAGSAFGSLQLHYVQRDSIFIVTICLLVKRVRISAFFLPLDFSVPVACAQAVTPNLCSHTWFMQKREVHMSRVSKSLIELGPSYPVDVIGVPVSAKEPVLMGLIGRRRASTFRA